jgi:hypothetical protein
MVECLIELRSIHDAVRVLRSAHYPVDKYFAILRQLKEEDVIAAKKLSFYWLK